MATTPHRARTEPEARTRYVDSLSRSLDCITKTLWVQSPPLTGPMGTRTLSVTREGSPIRLRRDDGSVVYFRALQRFQPMQRDDGGWKMHTLEYKYEIWEPQPDRTNKPVLEWHFHPDSGTDSGCHLHVRATEELCGVASRRLHIPSERVAFESVVRFLVNELHVTPRHTDWDARISDTLLAFQTFRTWHGHAPPRP